MADKPYPYRYGKQIERLIGQFCRAMSGFQVIESSQKQDSFYRVPVRFGAMDRVVASALNNHNASTRFKLPVMSVSFEAIDFRREESVSPYHIEATTRNSSTGVSGQERMAPIPYTLTLSLNVLADSTSQLLEIQEQILLSFYPNLVIQSSNDILDRAYLSEIVMREISPTFNFPLGNGKQKPQVRFTFDMKIWLEYPRDDNSGIVKEIIENIYVEDSNGIQEIDSFIIDEDGVRDNDE